MTHAVPGTSSPVSSRPEAEARLRFVHAGFAAAAAWYDRLNDVFSFGLVTRWRRACLTWCEFRPGLALLDIATGTGELVIQAERALNGHGIAVGLDFCREMLSEAERKITGTRGVRVVWVQGRAEALPFRSATFDRVTVGFALRHVHDLGATLSEIARILKPGGRFVVLEFTRPRNRLARFLLLGYLRRVVPPLVGLVSRNRQVMALARYLPQSIAGFVSGGDLSRSIQAAGLTLAGTRQHMAGLVSLCVGVKPQAPGGRAAGDLAVLDRRV